MEDGVIESAQASFVETIPRGMNDLRNNGETTADALLRLVRSAHQTIDLTALYWSLRPEMRDDDMQGWGVGELVERFGAGFGNELYESLTSAASRGVRIRIVESPGFDEQAGGGESAELRARYPKDVDVRSVDLARWFDAGIMHQKLWVFDRRSFYVGSANNDWRSLSQVKELGVVVEDAPTAAAEATAYFETWWEFAELDPDDKTEVVFDGESGIDRRVPVWSSLVPAGRRAHNPLDRWTISAAHGWDKPLPVTLNGENGELVLSGAPAEVCVGGRPFDGDLLVATILDARSTVCVNVMDFAPVSIYRTTSAAGAEYAPPVWWPALFTALLRSVFTNRVEARLLVSEWSHSSPYIAPYLDALHAAARAATANPAVMAGRLEIRRFRVPGWEATGPKTTGGASVLYPGHTRVNHVKYIVTDRRVNVGTSNMTWDYFSATAGTSVNATHRSLIKELQQRFDRDWGSAYASPLRSAPVVDRGPNDLPPAPGLSH